MTVDLEEVHLNLSLKSHVSQETSPLAVEDTFIGPAIPAHVVSNNDSSQVIVDDTSSQVIVDNTSSQVIVDNTSQVIDNSSVRVNPYIIRSMSSVLAPDRNTSSPQANSLSNESSSLREKSASPLKPPFSPVDEVPSKGVPAPVTAPSKGVPAPATAPSKGVPAPATAPSKGVPAPATAPSKGVPAPATAPSKGVPAPAKKRRIRDVTKTRRFQNSLSFLLGSITDDSKGTLATNNNNDENSVNNSNEMDCSNSVSVPNNTSFKKRILPENFTVHQKDKAPTPEKTPQQVKKAPAPESVHTTKRPCPHKFTQPTLTKTTSKLFSSTPNNYLKGCKWSPDGLALLTCSRDKIVRIFNIPDITTTVEQHPTAQHSAANVPYDVEWNPEIDHLSAGNCNFAVSCKDSPVQLVNAFTGATLASFTAFNQVEVLISAFSVCYLSRDQLLGGYCKHVRVFDATRPGRDCTVIPVGDLQHQNNNSIVSTVAAHPTVDGLFGAGCYNSTVGLYSSQIKGVLMPFYGPQHGVTQIQFSKDGNRLYCGSRMEGEIYCFDTRYNGSVLHTYHRDVQTNQRIQFDINKSESMLATGNHDGAVLLFDLAGEQSVVNQEDDGMSKLRFEAHTDTVNGVSFHPYWGLLATASGRRHFHIEDSETEENSLKIWSF